MSPSLSKQFDVVVLGGGNAALTAAITAACARRRAVVLEAAPRFYRGGNTRHTRDLRCSHDGTAPTMTGPYEVTEFLDDIYRVIGGQTDKQLAELTVACGPNSMRRFGRVRSITRCSMIAAWKDLRCRNRTGRGGSRNRRSTPIRCGPASLSPISV